MKKRLSTGKEREGNTREGGGGRVSNGSVLSLRERSRFLRPVYPPTTARRDFSFFGTRPPLCLFQYALLTLHRPLARSRSSTFQLDIFNSFFFFRVIVLRESNRSSHSRNARRYATTLFLSLSLSRLSYDSTHFSPVTGYGNVLGTIPRFALCGFNSCRRRSSYSSRRKRHFRKCVSREEKKRDKYNESAELVTCIGIYNATSEIYKVKNVQMCIFFLNIIPRNI